MEKASRRKQLKRAELWGAQACHVFGQVGPGEIMVDLPEDIRQETDNENEGEEEQRAVVRAYKEVERNGDIVSYGVIFDDGDGQAWSA